MYYSDFCEADVNFLFLQWRGNWKCINNRKRWGLYMMMKTRLIGKHGSMIP